MAVDEALLESAAERGSCTLRFYGWDRPTLSLGYFQNHADRAAHPASADCDLVRRQTGGGAILHDQELTYSLTIPVTHTLARDARWLYRAVHEALLRALAAVGVAARLCDDSDQCTADVPFLCFNRRTSLDVLLDGSKICGSAQRRRRGVILQHGSLLLARSAYAPDLPGIRELTGNLLAPRQLIAGWQQQLETGLGLKFESDQLSTTELEFARRLADEKYGAAPWTMRR